MKVLMIFSLFLVCSSQALFLQHFEKKLNAITGWFSHGLDSEVVERSDEKAGGGQEEGYDQEAGAGQEAGAAQNELFKVSRRREEADTETDSTETESKIERSGVRESRCRTVDTKVSSLSSYN